MSHCGRYSTVVSNLDRDRIPTLRSPDGIAGRIAPEVSEGWNEILPEKPRQGFLVDHCTYNECFKYDVEDRIYR